MRPIFFDGRFGWLHEPAPGSGPEPGPALGVVLCAAFAQEEICTHHGLMLLADRLAAAGMPTLRFDYLGTGDSADIGTGVDVSLASLSDDVAHAVDALRQECAVGAVALCGLRLGAAVAVQAAARIADIAGVALLAPVIDGRTFLRETRAAAGVAPLAQLDPVPPIDAGLPLNTNGFRWSGALQVEVAGIELTRLPAPAPQVMLATIRRDRRAPAYAAMLREAGVAVAEQPFADYDAYMLDPTVHVTPHATFAAVEAWLRDLPPGTARVAASAPVTIEGTLAGDDFEELPQRFGPDDRVFGMLCRPRSGTTAPVAAMLLQEGSSHHIGNGRAYVALARRLAAAGIASLRMDLTGMGDSPAGGNDRSPYFDPERYGEAVSGIDLLAAAGAPRVVAFGLCSGAHLAFQIGVADPRVAGIYLINLPKFVWDYGDDIRPFTRDSKRTLRAYLRSMRTLSAYRRVLRGEGDLTGIARVLARRAVNGGIEAIRGLRAPPPGSDRAIVRDQMRRLSARGVETLLFFTDDDVGLTDMTRHFGRGARRMKAHAPARMIVMPRADHHFNGTDVRRRYIDAVVASLTALGRSPRA